jgi:negative regulator of flagellin synthesis FlgM
MVIDKIGKINNIVETKKTGHVSGSKQTKRKDEVQISSEAKQAAEVSRLTPMVKEASDVRVERVNEIKERIANGTYDFNDNKVLEQVASKIAQFLMRP